MTDQLYPITSIKELREILTKLEPGKQMALTIPASLDPFDVADTFIDVQQERKETAVLSYSDLTTRDILVTCIKRTFVSRQATFYTKVFRMKVGERILFAFDHPLWEMDIIQGTTDFASKKRGHKVRYELDSTGQGGEFQITCLPVS